MSTVQLPERCYTLDIVYPLMVVGTAERHIQIFNLTNPTSAYKVSGHHNGSFEGPTTTFSAQTMISPLKWQTRIVSCFPSGNGFAVGSVEGRVAIQYVTIIANLSVS